MKDSLYCLVRSSNRQQEDLSITLENAHNRNYRPRHSLRKTAINDAIRTGAQMLHAVREFAGHRDIRTTELYFVRKGEDTEMAARRIQIRVPGRQRG
jgi:hypothetical protein